MALAGPDNQAYLVQTQASSFKGDDTTGSIIAGIIKKKLFRGMDPYDTIGRAAQGSKSSLSMREGLNTSMGLSRR